MDLPGRAALITGARRIGAVVATELAARGVDVAITFNRGREEAEATLEAIRRHGRRGLMLQADLSRSSEAARVVEEAATEFGRLDILINMASVYVEVPFDSSTEAHWDANMNVDLKASYLCARAAVPRMRALGGGRIINFSDWLSYSHRPRYRGYLPYYVAKSAIIGLTEALALELADDNILVNAIAPGPILAAPSMGDQEFSAVEKATPLGRWGGEMEIVKAVVALIDSDFMTGETVRVDGGRHVR
ncbi:MAG: SDR family oxidoreductase [Acidobacteria bacterium]|nr:SDR family oxidoreductase [Acidobacteriota bacterium]